MAVDQPTTDAIERTQTMYELCFELPNEPEMQPILLKMDIEQQMRPAVLTGCPNVEVRKKLARKSGKNNYRNLSCISDFQSRCWIFGFDF